MTVSTTTRLNLTRWTSNSDAFTRNQMDNSHVALENKVTAYLQGAVRPAASAAYLGTLFWDTGTSTLSYCDGTTWTGLVAGSGGWGSPTTLAVGNSPVDGVLTTASRSDHRHGMPAFGSVALVGTGIAPGTSALPIRSDHVHKLGVGAISDTGQFMADVVDGAAIGALAVGTSELAPNAVTPSALASGAVNNAALATNAVAQTHMQDNSVGAAEILTGAVGTSELGSVYGSTITGVNPDYPGTAGVDSLIARSDHVHPTDVHFPSTFIGVANADGVYSLIARSDHVHAVESIQPIGIKMQNLNRYAGSSTLTTVFSGSSVSSSLPTGWGSAELYGWAVVEAEVLTGSPQIEAYLKVQAVNGPTYQSGVIGAGDQGYCTPVGAFAVASGTVGIGLWTRVTAGTATLIGSGIGYIMVRIT